MIACLVIISFVLFCPLSFFLSYLVTVFLDISNFVALVKFWYVLGEISMPEVLSCLFLFPTINSGTLVLGGFVKCFPYSLDFFVSDCTSQNE